MKLTILLVLAGLVFQLGYVSAPTKTIVYHRVVANEYCYGNMKATPLQVDQQF